MSKFKRDEREFDRACERRGVAVPSVQFITGIESVWWDVRFWLRDRLYALTGYKPKPRRTVERTGPHSFRIHFGPSPPLSPEPGDEG